MNRKTISDRLAAEIAKEGTTRRKLLEALVSRGLDPCDQLIRIAVKRVQNPLSFENIGRMAAEIAKEGTTRPKLLEAVVSRGLDHRDQVIRDAVRRIKIAGGSKSEKLILKQQLKMHAVAMLLSTPIAAVWTPQARKAIVSATEYSAAHEISVGATLEAVARLATAEWGFVNRYLSKSGKGGVSHYLALPAVGVVRISNHILPLNDQRAKRFARDGAFPWGDIVVGETELLWSMEKWREHLIAQAHVGAQLEAEAKTLRKSKRKTHRELAPTRSWRDAFESEDQKWIGMIDSRQRNRFAT